MDAAQLKKFDEDLKRTFEEFKKRNDQAIVEMETRAGEATGETKEALEKTNTELTSIREALKDLETRLNRPGISSDDPDADSEEKKLETRAFAKYLRLGIENDVADLWTPEEKRALTSASDGTGGFLVPIDYEGGIIMNAYNLAELRPICQVGTTGRDTVQMGALSKPTVAWGNAAIAISEQQLTAGNRTITIYKLQALTLVAVDTLEDAEANLEQEINDAFARALAEAEDDAFAVGPGDNEPRGIVSNPLVQANYVVSGVTDKISDASHNGVDALTDVMYKPKKTYSRNGKWAFNSTTEAEIRKLKDGEGRYLWQPSVQADKPPMLLGKTIVNPEGMPDIAAGTYPIVFGDFMAGYKIRDRKGMTVQRLIERYAEYDQVGFKVVKRVGADVTLPEAFAPMKIGTS